MMWSPSPNFTKGRGKYKPTAVVVHITDGSGSGALSWLKNPASKVSAHYLVLEDGAILNLVKEEDTAWHTGTVDRPHWLSLITGVNPNLYTIGIEFAGKISDAARPAQQVAGAKLIDEILNRWKIPCTRKNIINHNEIRWSKACPGKIITANFFYPFVLFLRYLRNV